MQHMLHLADTPPLMLASVLPNRELLGVLLSLILLSTGLALTSHSSLVAFGAAYASPLQNLEGADVPTSAHYL